MVTCGIPNRYVKVANNKVSSNVTRIRALVGRERKKDRVLNMFGAMDNKDRRAIKQCVHAVTNLHIVVSISEMAIIMVDQIRLITSTITVQLNVEANMKDKGVRTRVGYLNR